MPQERPQSERPDTIADICELPPDQLAARKEELRRELLPCVLASEPIEGGQALEFETMQREKLEALVAFERQCCGSLDWQLVESRTAGRIRLEIRGLPPGKDLLAAIQAA